LKSCANIQNLTIAQDGLCFTFDKPDIVAGIDNIISHGGFEGAVADKDDNRKHFVRINLQSRL